jgi:septum formation protein
LYLASASPRRRDLLHDAGYAFTVAVPSEAAEDGPRPGETPEELVRRFALQKARDVACRLVSGLVIGCDTLVECEGHVLGKPQSADEARTMLRRLSGKRHTVVSGLCLWNAAKDRGEVRSCRSTLQAAALDDAEVEVYLATGQWAGKAGGFGYQDRPGWLQLVEGSESNVVGLPLELLAEMLALHTHGCGPGGL